MSESRPRRLEDCITLVTEKVVRHKDSSLPYVGLEHIPSSGTSLLGTAAAQDSVSANNVFRAGDILFGKLRPHLRKCIRVAFDGYCSMDILVLRPKPGVDPRFAGFLMQSGLVFAAAIAAEEGTKMPRCSWSDLRGIQVPIPPLGVQTRIGIILTTLDKEIAQTEALIAKSQQIKAGLMHDLFTRGLTADGKLRPPCEEAPDLYKQSPLGWIPNDWRAEPLSTVVPRVQYGISDALDDGPGIPVLRMNNFAEGEADLSQLKYSSGSGARSLFLKVGDVLFNRTNSIDHVGRTGIWRGQLVEASFASYLVRLEPDSSLLISEFLNLWLNLDSTQIRIRKGATPSVHQVNINPTTLRRNLIAIPGLEEQSQVVVEVASARTVIQELRRTLQKLRSLKSAFMHDLLTGRVRVPVPKKEP